VRRDDRGKWVGEAIRRQDCRRRPVVRGPARDYGGGQTWFDGRRFWLRDLLKLQASEGRTVFVSSHLLAEMALMADELVVVGRGRLIASGQADSFVSDFTRRSVLVRSPQVDTLLRTVLDAVPTVEVTQAPDGSATLSGVDAARVGELAADVGLVLHELATRTASLEEAFFEATGATEEYVGQLRSAPETAGGIR
jgi:ABC-2 type transport system ATP-binding protein